jgi:hypothetical protein
MAVAVWTMCEVRSTLQPRYRTMSWRSPSRGGFRSHDRSSFLVRRSWVSLISPKYFA